MPCSGGRELKQMFANATDELGAARKAMADEAVLLVNREKRVRNAEENHKWTSATLIEHLNRCEACQSRESVMRPAYRG
jgi:hypothetical protein